MKILLCQCWLRTHKYSFPVFTPFHYSGNLFPCFFTCVAAVASSLLMSLLLSSFISLSYMEQDACADFIAAWTISWILAWRATLLFSTSYSFFFPIVIFLCILSTKYKSLLPDALTCHNYHFLDLFMSSWPCLNFEFIFIIFYLYFFAKISVKASLQRSQLSNASYFWEH